VTLRFFIKFFAPVGGVSHSVQELFCALRKSGRVAPHSRSLPQRVCPVRVGSVNLSFFVDIAHKIRRVQLYISSKCRILDKHLGIYCHKGFFVQEVS
jgi:hypothetical protein